MQKLKQGDGFVLVFTLCRTANRLNGVSKAYGECQASTAGQERTNELFAD